MNRREESLPENPPPAPRADEIAVFGKVIDAYGLRGAIKLRPFVDDLPAWARLPEWCLGAEGRENDPDAWRSFRVARCDVRDRLLIAELSGIADRSAAESLRGMLVGVPRAGLPPTDEDEFYWDDLIGLAVENLNEQPIGVVHGLIETPANDVLRVVDGAGRERLLPFVAPVVLDVDRIRRRIRVDWELDW
ncbi:MAG: ribosome maturation factor RimM [Candidatus Accumulibacter sp.]|jgi:16S rRNA processing protein RimM|nr:ribosome maturation factor RimM [Accumulibacter sp.]